MSHKVDLREVIAFSDKVGTSSKEVELGIEAVINDIQTLRSMDSFSGFSASSAKKYFTEFHLKVLDAFEVLFSDLRENLKDHIETFKSNVDANTAAVIQTDYLESVKQEIDLEYQKLRGYERSAQSTIQGITDIISIHEPNIFAVTNDYRAVLDTMDNLEKSFDAFMKKGKSHPNTTK